MGEAAVVAVERYLRARNSLPMKGRVLELPRARGSGDRQVRRLVKLYALLATRRFYRSPAQFPPRLCDAPAERWRGPASHSGTPWPCPPVHHPEVHASLAQGPSSCLRQGSPQSISDLDRAPADFALDMLQAIMRSNCVGIAASTILALSTMSLSQSLAGQTIGPRNTILSMLALTAKGSMGIALTQVPESWNL